MPTKKLTDLFVDRAKPPASGRLEYFDASFPGLALRITSEGGKSWCVFYRIGGRLRRYTLGRYPALKPADARREAQGALERVRLNIDPADEKRARRRGRDASGPSFEVAAVFAQFMAKHVRKRNGTPIRASTRRETGRLLGLAPDGGDLSTWSARSPRTGVVAEWHGRDVRTLTKRDVLDLLDDIVERDAPITANRTLTALKTFFGWCVARDIVAASPCQHVSDPSPEKSAERELADVELVAVWRAAEKIGFPYGSMVQLLLLTGQRRDEVRELPDGELDRRNQLWRLPGERTKNGREHHVPLSTSAIAVLDTLPKIRSRARHNDPLLFTLDGRVAISNLSRRKKRLDEAMLRELRAIDPDALALKPWRLHHLRHTLKTWMQRVRIPKDVRNAVQNHYDNDMDELYGHYSFEKEKRDALDRWARHVEALVSGVAGAEVVPLRRA
jgi:integrase